MVKTQEDGNDVYKVETVTEEDIFSELENLSNSSIPECYGDAGAPVWKKQIFTSPGQHANQLHVLTGITAR